MARPANITDTDKRKMDTSFADDGSVTIRKHWYDSANDQWFSREITINGDEWDRICEIRDKVKVI